MSKDDYPPVVQGVAEDELDDWEYHVEIVKTFSKDGELLRCVSSVIPGKFEPDEATKKYWAWLDARRTTNKCSF